MNFLPLVWLDRRHLSSSEYMDLLVPTLRPLQLEFSIFLCTNISSTVYSTRLRLVPGNCIPREMRRCEDQDFRTARTTWFTQRRVGSETPSGGGSAFGRAEGPWNSDLDRAAEVPTYRRAGAPQNSDSSSAAMVRFTSHAAPDVAKPRLV